MADFQTIGKNHVRVDALEKVTGKATYAGDVYLPGMLMCKLLTSTESHARIVRLDVSQAEALPEAQVHIQAQAQTHVGDDLALGLGHLLRQKMPQRFG